MIKLINGDCLDHFKDIEPKSINMFLCDLPYQITCNKWDTMIPFDKMWENILKLGKDNAIYAFTASQPFTSMLVMSNLDMFRHEWIWQKNKGSNFANTVREPFKEHEEVLIFSKGKWTYNKQMQERTGGGLERIKYDFNCKTASENYREFEYTPKNQGELRVPSSVQKFNTENGDHPTQKPVPLMEYLIKTYTNKGDLVMDFTMGSGTTGVACANLERNFIGIEREEKYFNTACKRIREALPLFDKKNLIIQSNK